MTELKIENISKVYPNGVKAVNNISFTIEKGDFFVLVGPSGCGKSTLLRMIAGLEEISEGTLKFDGEKVNELAPKERNIGMVFQNYALYPHLTVFQNIAFPLKIKKSTKNQIKEKVNQVAELTGLSELLNRKPKELSGGQRQRVALARAIAKEPKIFLFDEPLSNLDAKLRIQMRNEIISLHNRIGVTSVYVTHDQIEAMTMGTKIAVLNGGELQQLDTPENLYKHPANLFVAKFIGTPQINIFEGSIENSVFREKGGGLAFNVENIESKKSILLAIRPEALIEANDNPANQIEVTITNIEYLGNEYLVYFQSPSGLMSSRSNQKPNKSIGDKITLTYKQKDILFF